MAAAITVAAPACLRADAASPMPMLREIIAVAAIIKPTAMDTEKNWIAKANPMAATSVGSPSCEIHNSPAASTRNTKVMPMAPVAVIRTTCPIVDPFRNRPCATRVLLRDLRQTSRKNRFIPRCRMAGDQHRKAQRHKRHARRKEKHRCR